MAEKKEREHVKLYRALSGTPQPDAEGGEAPEVSAELVGQRLRVILVGKEDRSLIEVRKVLDAAGHDTTLITSGKDFLGRVDGLSSDLTLIWFHTDDMQGQMVGALARGHDTENVRPFVLIIPEELVVGTAELKSGKVDHVRSLPIKDEELQDLIAGWAGTNKEKI